MAKTSRRNLLYSNALDDNNRSKLSSQLPASSDTRQAAQPQQKNEAGRPISLKMSPANKLHAGSADRRNFATNYSTSEGGRNQFMSSAAIQLQ